MQNNFTNCAKFGTGKIGLLKPGVAYAQLQTGPVLNDRRAVAMAKQTDPRQTTSVDRAIGVRIRARRLELAASQTELADALGITFQQIQKYEKGLNRISASKLIEVARALETSVPALLPERHETDAIADPMLLEIASILAVLNAEGRRLLLRMAKGLAKDEDLRRPSRQRE